MASFFWVRGEGQHKEPGGSAAWKDGGRGPGAEDFAYLNVDAIHYPNYFYLDGAGGDSLESHRAALVYVDGQLGRLFDGWKKGRGETFVICCSDHGTCYGEDGCQFHGINHPMVNTVPYKHFLL